MPLLPVYPSVTRATLRGGLKGRLNSAIFWSDAELNLYLQEALTCWQAFSRYFRSRATVTTHTDGAGNYQFFYDLAQELPQLEYTVTDSQILSLIEYHLLELQSGIPSNPAWQGTEMWAQGHYTGSLERRRNRFLLDSQAVVQHFISAAVSAGSPRVTFPASLIDVRRVAWVDANGVYTVLWRDDEFAANAYSQSWASSLALPAPLAYSVAVAQPFTLQFLPPPGDAGSLDVLAIAQGPPLNPVTGVILGIPDNYAWAVKWGALADLLSEDGPGRDLERAQYCEQRYREAVQLAKIMPTAINAAIGENATQFDTVFNLDAYNSSWHNTNGTPLVLALAGQNILATSCVPDGAYGIGLDIVGNCPVMTDDVTPVLISADIADLIVDEAEHIAEFKEGGAEFAASMPLHTNFINQATLYRNRSLAQAHYWPDMSGANQLEFQQRMVAAG
jgi:hypothetical protein